MTTHQNQLNSRPVSDFGETLVVRELNGYKALVDPCDENVFVQVPAGRHANLVCYNFNGLTGRDAHVVVVKTPAGLGFASVLRPYNVISLGALSPGQQVDVMVTVTFLVDVLIAFFGKINFVNS